MPERVTEQIYLAKKSRHPAQVRQTPCFHATIGSNLKLRFGMNKPKLPSNIDFLQWVGPDNPASAESGLIHCTRIPPQASQAQPAPLLVMIHGWGGDESVMWTFKQLLPAHIGVVTPRAPLEITEGDFVWFEEAGLQPPPESSRKAVATLEKFLTTLPRLYPVDPTHTVLMGFSQGAFIGNAFTLTHPYDLIGVASLSGAMPDMPDVDRHDSLLAGIPVFISHGTRDETVPLEAARHTRNTYQTLGADVTYGEYSVGHKMNTQGLKDLERWLARLFPKTSGHS